MFLNKELKQTKCWISGDGTPHTCVKAMPSVFQVTEHSLHGKIFNTAHIGVICCLPLHFMTSYTKNRCIWHTAHVYMDTTWLPNSKMIFSFTEGLVETNRQPHALREPINLSLAPHTDSVLACGFAINRLWTVSSFDDDKPQAMKLPWQGACFTYDSHLRRISVFSVTNEDVNQMLKRDEGVSKQLVRMCLFFIF